MKIRGFTLIELMIVVTLIAIIAAIAIPSYQKYVEKTRRADAQSALLQAAQSLERCFTRLNAYNAAGCPGVTGLTSEGFYRISFADGEPTATTFELEAEPVGAQENDPCGTFTLDQRGQRTAAGDASLRCWGS